MQESNILRLAMVLSDSASTTLNKYICKLVEAVLFASGDVALNLSSISESIDSQFGLTFDTKEIEMALLQKGSGRVIQQSGFYTIADKVKTQIASQTDPLMLLKQYISEYAVASQEAFDEDVFLDCILKYLYYCFNSTRKNLMNLLQNKAATISEVFSPTNYEVSLINGFIFWDNDVKNELLYKIIVSSYEYCMLTTKKNELLSKKIFRGKRFYLDTNIIFRMAGINKDDRKFATDSFVKKCSEVGIELCYTNETLGELFRVIEGQIKYIRYFTQGQAPISSHLIQKMGNDFDTNDFYDIYCNWTKVSTNGYRDYLSFQKHLVGMVTTSLSGLKMVTIDNHMHQKDSDTFASSCLGLRQFKNSKRPSKQVSDESLQTDVNNIFHTLSVRKRIQSHTLWQVNDFMVSADQLLTAWAEQTYPGVPVVVIPSTWLSIILRFSGRTHDDYKSYCLFMSLRYHRVRSEDPIINPIQIMLQLAQKTNDVTIKEKIITELLENKNDYRFVTKEDYSTSVEMAFDKIVSDLKSENKSLFLLRPINSAMNSKAKKNPLNISWQNVVRNKNTSSNMLKIKPLKKRISLGA